MAKPKQPSAGSGDMIDGEAVEKSAQTASPRQGGTHADTASAFIDSKFLAKPSPKVQAIAFVALGLSVFAMGLAGVAIWQQRHHAAEMVGVRAAVSGQQTPEQRQGSQDRNSVTDQAALDDRFAAIMAQLAAERERQQAALAEMQEQLAKIASAPVPHQVADAASGVIDRAGRDSVAFRADMDRRFAALEAALANLAIPASSSLASPGASVSAESAKQSLISQTGLLVVSGLLADNLAGQPLDRWVALLQGLADRGISMAGLDQLRQTAIPLPASAPQLIQDAYDLVPKMTAALNRAGDNAGFLEKTGAKIGQLVQLRPIGDLASGNAMALRDFETALAVKDLAAAMRAAGQWSSTDPPLLDNWLQAAVARHSLDEAVNALVTSHLAAAIELP